jgi:hypothetical protein
MGVLFEAGLRTVDVWTMAQGWLVSRAEGEGGLYLVMRSCWDSLEALLRIQGGVHWVLETSSLF